MPEALWALDSSSFTGYCFQKPVPPCMVSVPVKQPEQVLCVETHANAVLGDDVPARVIDTLRKVLEGCPACPRMSN